MLSEGCFALHYYQYCLFTIISIPLHYYQYCLFTIISIASSLLSVLRCFALHYYQYCLVCSFIYNLYLDALPGYIYSIKLVAG